MSKKGPFVFSVVIPAFNEADRLPQTLERIDRFFFENNDLCPTEIIIVDDGSTDETANISSSPQLSSNSAIRTLHHPHNLGKGAAVRTGFCDSQGQWVLLSDADLAAPIEGLHRLLAASGHSTVVIGSRALDRSLLFHPQPIYRDLMGRAFNVLVRSLLLPGIYDTQCGFKLFPGPIARALAGSQKTDGFAYDVELLAISRSWGVKIIEIPVPWGHVEDSRVLPGRHSAQMFRDLLKIAIRRWSRNLPPSPSGDGFDG